MVTKDIAWMMASWARSLISKNFAAKPVLGHDDELLRGDVGTKFTVQGWGQAAARHQLVGGQEKPALPHIAPHLAEQLSPSAVPGCSIQFPGSAPSGTSPKAILVLPLLQAFQRDDWGHAKE